MSAKFSLALNLAFGIEVAVLASLPDTHFGMFLINTGLAIALFHGAAVNLEEMFGQQPVVEGTQKNG